MEATETRKDEPATGVVGTSSYRPQRSIPRILFLIDEMSAITAGGTERQLLQLVDIAWKSGLAPQVCVLRGTEWLTPQVAGCNVKHFQIEAIRSRSGIAALRQLLQWMRAEKFHILQAFFSESNLLGPWAGRFAGIPIILGTRRNLNHAMKEGPNRLGLRMQWVSNLLVDRIIANSEAVLQKVSESEWLSKSKLCVVYNGIDPMQMQPQPGDRAQMRRHLGLTDEHILVGNVSGLRKIKGVDLFVDAAARAFRQDRRLRFVLVGDGELREEIEAQIKRVGLGSAFILAGAADDVRPYLAAMDIAVLCSMGEGFSNSLLEYMAAELPIIATDVGGNREALGGSGILIPAGDEKALVEAVVTFLDPGLRRTYAAEALKAVQRFDVKFAERKMQEIYWRHLGNQTGKDGRGMRRNVQNSSHIDPVHGLQPRKPENLP